MPEGKKILFGFIEVDVKKNRLLILLDGDRGSCLSLYLFAKTDPTVKKLHGWYLFRIHCGMMVVLSTILGVLPQNFERRVWVCGVRWVS